jgi:Flp pilus assembly protein TadG
VLSRIRSHTAGESGQALIEFALVLPILLVILLGMLDFGKVFNYWNDTTHITAEGARFAAVDRKPSPTGTGSLQQQLHDQVETTELQSGGSDSLPAAAQVCISFPNGTSNPGDPVRVTMTFEYHWLAFITAQTDLLSKTVSSSSTMRLETFPTHYVAGCA